MDLAVGVVIGGAFQKIVNSLVKDILSPILGLFAKNSFDDLSISFMGVTVRYGSFITEVINFIIMAFVIFLLVKALNGLAKLHGHTEDFCHFMAGKAVNGQKPFWEWTEQEEDFSVYRTWRLVCYTFFRKWK